MIVLRTNVRLPKLSSTTLAYVLVVVIALQIELHLISFQQPETLR